MAKIQPLGEPKLSTESATPHFTITWENLSYDVIKSNIDMFVDKHILQKHNVQKTKRIFTCLCGEFKCGELSALMGPSGAGKSTLLECLCGKRENGRSGLVGLIGDKKVNVAFIPQHDHFFNLLTVREALLFATKLQNEIGNDVKSSMSEEANIGVPSIATEFPQNQKSFHNNIVNSIMEKLSLESCAEVRIMNLSGGQQKRLSIAQELVVKPDVLILDEPTSGLDSASCFQTVELLRSLTEQKPPIAIIATIHQPSAKVFNLFHQIYVLSVIGKCIYNGPPKKLLPWLSGVGLRSPEFYNPADFIIDVSYGEYGKKVLHQMAEAVDSQNEAMKQLNPIKEVKILQDRLYYRDVTYSLEHFGILFYRASLVLLRDPISNWFRLFIHFGVGLSMGVLYQGMGGRGGCPPDLSNGFEVSKVDSIKNEIFEENYFVYNNVGMLFFALVFSQFQGIVLNVITFPLIIRALKKEISNGWYSPLTFFTSLSISVLPASILNAGVFSTLVHLMTEQPYEIRRYLELYLIMLMVSLISQAQGMIVGLLFAENLTAAVFVGPASVVPILLFSGFLLKTDAIPYYLRFLSVISYMRYGVEGAFVAIFGNQRCGENTAALVQMAKDQVKLMMYTMFRIVRNSLEEDYDGEGGDIFFSANLTDSLVNGLMPSYLSDAEVDDNGNMVSYVLKEYNLTNASYYEKVLIMLVFVILLRIAAYFLFKMKVKVVK